MTLGLGDDKGWATWQGEAPARSASFNWHYMDTKSSRHRSRSSRPVTHRSIY
jgi:hypothetical protein